MSNRKIERRADLAVCSDLNGLPPFVQKILANRGVTSVNDIDYSLTGLADFKLLKNIDKAVDALLKIIERRLSVVIVGDFDADGATSTALLMQVFPLLGISKVSYVVPNRFDFGYGLSSWL